LAVTLLIVRIRQQGDPAEVGHDTT
jgi:hypothetical protein